MKRKDLIISFTSIIKANIMKILSIRSIMRKTSIIRISQEKSIENDLTSIFESFYFIIYFIAKMNSNISRSNLLIQKKQIFNERIRKNQIEKKFS